MPKEKLKHLTPRTQTATDNFIQRNIVNSDKTYTYAKAMVEAGFSPLYISRYGAKLSENIIVKQQINTFVEKIQNRIINKTAITLEWVVNKHLEIIEKAEKINDLVVMTTNIKLIGDTIGAYKQGVFDAGDAMAEITEESKRIAAAIPDSYFLESPKSPELPASPVNSDSLLQPSPLETVEDYTTDGAIGKPVNSASQDASGLTNSIESDAKDGGK